MSARAELVTALADDELLLGARDAEWTGIAPLLEEDVALASIAQDELGHAIALYGLIHGAGEDAPVYKRTPDQLRHARLVERPTRDFAFTVARRLSYETADRLRVASLRASSWKELAAIAAKVEAEEALHFDHALFWTRRLLSAEPGRTRVERAFADVLPLANAILTPLPGEAELLKQGVLQESWAVLGERWRTAMCELLQPFDLARLVPSAPAESDRHAPPSKELIELWRDLTSVRRTAMESEW